MGWIPEPESHISVERDYSRRVDEQADTQPEQPQVHQCNWCLGWHESCGNFEEVPR